MLPASVLYGGQEGLKPLSFKMCAFQGEKPLTNRLLVFNGQRFAKPFILLAEPAIEDVVFLILACLHLSLPPFPRQAGTATTGYHTGFQKSIGNSYSTGVFLQLPVDVGEQFTGGGGRGFLPSLEDRGDMEHLPADHHLPFAHQLARVLPELCI